MAQMSKHKGSAMAETDGSGNKYRPSYPPSLVKLIMDFHRAHSNSLRLAHDIGAGSGAFVPSLAEYFQHVHVSDPSPTNIARARESLGVWYAENWWKAKFSFSVLPGERSGEAMVEGCLDFASIMDSSHRMDIEQTVQSIGRSLAPNGTLAVVMHNRCPTVIGNEKVDGALRALHEALSARIEQDDIEISAVSHSNAALENVPLPDGMFIQDVTKRIKINFYGVGDDAFIIPGQQQRVAPSRVNVQHRRYAYNQGDPEAEGWRQVVDAEWFDGYVESLGVNGDQDLVETQVCAIKTAIESNSQDGRVEIEWMVVVLLATRK